MKKVLLVSKNKRVIENITMVFNASIHSELCLLSLSRYENIGEDINEFGANIIVIDMTGGKQAEIQLLYDFLADKKEIKCVALIDDNRTERESTEMVFDGCMEYIKITEELCEVLSRYA